MLNHSEDGHVSQGFWDTEVAEEQAVEPMQAPPPAPEAPPEVDEPVAVALSADEFAALEERILRAVNLVRRERQARAEAEERAAAAEQRVAEFRLRMAQSERELEGLRAERGQVRQRVERLLKQLDTLEL